MMVGHRSRRRPISDINIVPYIDVMLVLLVIFMITAPLLTQGVKVDLPQAPSEPLEQQKQEPLVVTVDADANLYLNYGDDQGTPLVPDILFYRVRALLLRRPGTPVLVRGDRATPYGDVVVAMTLLQRAGAPSVGLMTKTPEHAEK
uniref:Tol-Pal system protein TolR n=1 Tax=Candidatus Kentrum sp. TUN TaxID=2126343 RepID=A0A450ZM96_9GAMM|nr:MAG: Cell division and transport-associated protein TolR [Candidatus Kentron sp. TUN]VFK57701.1 MAG: Cell division and transport-associated protein TolR [Candidatus Kentron sp. TUN]VFK66481.1 MAG: Cell division and transport-associated protein TolR [Candidatus Kentron sp. TUN]